MPYTPNNPYIPGDPYSYDLKWIVEKLKEAISLYQPLNDKFDDLYDYVHDYFANLDLTAEVQAIIDQMEADGYFNTLINQIVTDSGTIESTTTAWLAANVTPVGSAVVVDSSLSVAGAAADAKITGEYVKPAAASLKYNGVYELAPDLIESGSWAGNTKTVAPTRLRYAMRPHIDNGGVVNVITHGLYAIVDVYADENSSTLLQSSGWVGGANNLKFKSNYDGIICIAFANAGGGGGTAINPGDYVCDTYITNISPVIDELYNQKLGIVPPFYDYVEVDTINQTLTLPKFTMLVGHDFKYETSDTTVVSYSHLATSAIALMFDISTSMFSFVSHADVFTELKNNKCVVLFMRNRGDIAQTALDCAFPYKVNGKIFGIDPQENNPAPYRYKYQGAKILSDPAFDCYKMFTISYSSTYVLNDIDVYEDQILCALNPGYIYVYDFNGNRLHEIIADIAHGNIFQISNTKADASDPYPLIYSNYSNVINVIRIKSDYTSEVVRTINLSTADYGYYTSSVIDFDNNKIYTLGHTDNSPLEYPLNTIRLCTSDLSTATKESELVISNFGLIQGGKYHNGHLIIATSDVNVPRNHSIKSIDIASGAITSAITEFPSQLANTGTELEGLAIHDGSIIITNWYDFYRLDI